MLVVYLSNRYIRVVDGGARSGKITVKKMYYTIDQVGCIMNGMITNEEDFQELISELWTVNKLPKKDVALVIDSNQLTVRNMDVPAMKPKKTIDYLAREFTSIERIADPVYGYFQMNGRKADKVNHIFAMMVPGNVVQSYLDVFGRLGIQISSIDSATGAMVRLLDHLTEVTDKTAIVQFVDGITLTNVIIVNGEYNYSSRVRLFSDPETDGFTTEIVRSLNNLMQFAKTQNLSDSIHNVYIAGLTKKDQYLYEETMEMVNPELEVDELVSGDEVAILDQQDEYKSFSNFALAIGGLLRTNKKTNVVNNMNGSQEKAEKKSKMLQLVIPPVIAFVIVAVACLITGISYFRTNSQLKEVQQYNQDPNIIEKCQEFDILTVGNELKENILNSTSKIRDIISGYPIVDSRVVYTVQESAANLVEAEIVSYSAETGELTVDVVAKEPERTNRFISNLRGKKSFQMVNYDGYSQDSAGDWRTQITAVLTSRQEAN